MRCFLLFFVWLSWVSLIYKVSAISFVYSSAFLPLFSSECTHCFCCLCRGDECWGLLTVHFALNHFFLGSVLLGLLLKICVFLTPLFSFEIDNHVFCKSNIFLSFSHVLYVLVCIIKLTRSRSSSHSGLLVLFLILMDSPLMFYQHTYCVLVLIRYAEVNFVSILRILSIFNKETLIRRQVFQL